jgi:hypothetical protein
MSDPLKLEKACTEGIQCDRVFSNKKALVIGDKSSVKEVGPSTIELGPNQT